MGGQPDGATAAEWVGRVRAEAIAMLQNRVSDLRMYHDNGLALVVSSRGDAPIA